MIVGAPVTDSHATPNAQVIASATSAVFGPEPVPSVAVASPADAVPGTIAFVYCDIWNFSPHCHSLTPSTQMYSSSAAHRKFADVLKSVAEIDGDSPAAEPLSSRYRVSHCAVEPQVPLPLHFSS